MGKEDKKSAPGENDFGRQVGIKAARKIKAQRRVTRTVWSGFGMMGLIGWSVAIPTLLGAALGLWLDDRHPGGRSWTLALMAAGLVLGCFNAWHWVTKEEREIHEQEADDDE